MNGPANWDRSTIIASCQFSSDFATRGDGTQICRPFFGWFFSLSYFFIKNIFKHNDSIVGVVIRETPAVLPDCLGLLFGLASSRVIGVWGGGSTALSTSPHEYPFSPRPHFPSLELAESTPNTQERGSEKPSTDELSTHIPPPGSQGANSVSCPCWAVGLQESSCVGKGEG